MPDYVKSLGFISKSTHEGQKQIRELIAQSHFLFVPSQAECFGLVFAEANSCGVPAVSTNVGGIPTIIKDGVNGKTFSLEDSINKYAQFIHDTYSDYKLYQEMARSSFDEYQKRLK